MNRLKKISSLSIPLFLLCVAATLPVAHAQSSSSCSSQTSSSAQSQSSLTRDYAKLVVKDKEVHYVRESRASSSARAIPFPPEWDVGPPCTHALNLNTVVASSAQIVDPSNPQKRLDITTSTNPAWLIKDKHDNTKLLQIAEMVDEGGQETYWGMNKTSVYYRVSTDNGVTFTPFTPMIQNGYNLTNRFPGIFAGTNGMWTSASHIVQLSNDEFIIPVAYWPLDSLNQPTVTGHSLGFGVSAVVIGKWNANKTDLSWTLSSHVFLPQTLSTRGILEPTVAELTTPGSLVMIGRGSNEGATHLDARRWVSRSTDYGRTWTNPIPLCYGDGTCFFSPSSASNLVRAPNGRLYWIGNISSQNANGNGPRYPLKMGELDEESLVIIKSSVITIDDFNSFMDSQDVQISNFSTYLDLRTGRVLIYLYRLDTLGVGELNIGFDPINWYQIGFEYGR